MIGWQHNYFVFYGSCIPYYNIYDQVQMFFLHGVAYKTTVHLILHPHRIAHTFLKFDSWSPEAGFIPIISTKGKKTEKERKNVRKKLSFMHTKRFDTVF